MASRGALAHPRGMSKALILLAHFDPESLSAALAASYERGFLRGGGEVERRNLTELSFDPVFRGAAQPLEPDLVEAQAAMRRATHLVWVFPIYWGTMPAVVKGFVDRTFLPGFAYRNTGRPLPEGLLRGRSSRIVTTMDSPRFWYRFAHGRAAHYSLDWATFAYSGIAPRFETTLYSVRTRTRAYLEERVRRLELDGEADARRLAKKSRVE